MGAGGFSEFPAPGENLRDSGGRARGRGDGEVEDGVLAAGEDSLGQDRAEEPDGVFLVGGLDAEPAGIAGREGRQAGVAQAPLQLAPGGL
ncbi:hypothetical protein HK102_013169, partial [Quaeritorhiza haematococci]